MRLAPHHGLVPRRAAIDTAGMSGEGRFRSGAAEFLANAERDARQTSVRVVARLWWLMLQRRWMHESALIFSALAFIAFVALLARAPMPEGPAYFTVRFALALSNAAIMSASIGGLSLSATCRLHLLPIQARDRFRVRILFGSPLRVPLFAATLIWALGHLATLHLSLEQLLVEVAQASLVVVATILASAVLAEPNAPAWLRVVRSAFVVVSGALTILIAGGFWRIENVEAPKSWFATPASAWLIGGGSGWGWELTALLGWVLAIALLLRAGEQMARHLPVAIPASVRTPDVILRVASAFPNRLRKELFLLLRISQLRRELVAAAGASLLAFSVGVPWILLGLPVVWLPFLCNGLGADLPLGGRTRYHLSRYRVRRALAWRHLAVGLATTCILVLASVVVAATRGIPAPVVGAATRWSYVVTGFYAVALLMLIAPATSIVALRYPLPVMRRTSLFVPQPAGPAAMLFWVLLVLVIVGSTSAGVFVLSTWLAMTASAVLPAAATSNGRLVIAACLTVTIALLVTIRSMQLDD